MGYFSPIFCLCKGDFFFARFAFFSGRAAKLAKVFFIVIKKPSAMKITEHIMPQRITVLCIRAKTLFKSTTHQKHTQRNRKHHYYRYRACAVFCGSRIQFFIIYSAYCSFQCYQCPKARAFRDFAKKQERKIYNADAYAP